MSSTAAAESAARYWTCEAESCATDHGVVSLDTTKLAQIYMYLWLCAEVHFSPGHMARFVETVPELEAPALGLVSDMHRYMTLKMERPMQLRLGTADPAADIDETMDMAVQDPDQDWHFAMFEWCMWPELEGFVSVPRARRVGQAQWKNLSTEWQKER